MNATPELTIRDIAQMAGVSIGTVSRVLNRAENVDPAIYAKTIEVINRTNFAASRRRRRASSPQAATGQRRISVCMSEMTADWQTRELFSHYLVGIERACRERDFRLDVRFAAPDKTPREFADQLRESSGVLLKLVSEEPEFLPLLDPRTPVVCFGEYNPAVPFPQIAIDNRAGGMLVTEKLLQAGHRAIAFVNPARAHRMFASRVDGYLAAMRRAGLRGDSWLIEADSTLDAMRRPMEKPPEMDAILAQLLALSPRPTAVVFANDWTAAGFYQACERAGVALPESFSVAAFDNTPMCEVMRPTLSSARIPLAEVAYFAAASLFDQIEGVGVHRHNKAYVQYMGMDFIARDSLAPPV